MVFFLSGVDRAPGSQSKNVLSNEAIPKSVARVLNAAKTQEEWRKKRKGEDDGTQGKPKKKARTDKDGAESTARTKGTNASHGLKILPGESLAHFNRYVLPLLSVCRVPHSGPFRRVEESMRPLVRDAMQTSAAVARKLKKEEELEKAAKKIKTSPAQTTAPQKSIKGKHKADESGSSEDEDEPAKPSKTTKPTASQDRPKEFATFSASAPRRLNDIAEAPPELKKLPRGAKLRKAADTGVKSSVSLREGVLSMAQKAMLEEERERVIKAYREMKKNGLGP